jgi:hypothetical protein
VYVVSSTAPFKVFNTSKHAKVYLQAMCRAHRTGQTHPVDVFVLIQTETYDVKRLQKMLLRLQIQELVFNGRPYHKFSSMCIFSESFISSVA